MIQYSNSQIFELQHCGKDKNILINSTTQRKRSSSLLFFPSKTKSENICVLSDDGRFGETPLPFFLSDSRVNQFTNRYKTRIPPCICQPLFFFFYFWGRSLRYPQGIGQCGDTMRPGAMLPQMPCPATCICSGNGIFQNRSRLGRLPKPSCSLMRFCSP